MSELVFRAATHDDRGELHRLIEAAYRGDGAKAGWTHEADLLGGPRTSVDELSGVLDDADQVMLLGLFDGVLVGCVRLMRQDDGSTYLGMLTVDPGHQTGGIGRRLLQAAEIEAARRFGSPRIEMTVISIRSELIAWYERRGYRRTGATSPFPITPGMFGDRPERVLEFVVLDKRIGDGALS